MAENDKDEIDRLRDLLNSHERAGIALQDRAEKAEADLARVRGILAEVLSAPVAVNDDGATVRINLEVQRSTRDLRARAEAEVER